MSTYRLIGLGTTHITSVCGNFHDWFNLCASCNNSPHNSKFTNTVSFHFTDCTCSMVAKMFEVHLTENKCTNSHHILGVELQRWKWMTVYPIHAIFCILWHLMVKLEFFSDKSICFKFMHFFLNKKGENYTMWPSMTKIVSGLT